MESGPVAILLVSVCLFLVVDNADSQQALMYQVHRPIFFRTVVNTAATTTSSSVIMTDASGGTITTPSTTTTSYSFGGLDPNLYVAGQMISYTAYFSRDYTKLTRGKTMASDPISTAGSTLTVVVPPYNGNVGMTIQLQCDENMVTIMQPTLSTIQKEVLGPRTLHFDISLRLKGTEAKPAVLAGASIDERISQGKSSKENQPIAITWPVPWSEVASYGEKSDGKLTVEVAVAVHN